MAVVTVFVTVKPGGEAPDPLQGFSFHSQRQAQSGKMVIWERETPQHLGDIKQIAASLKREPHVAEIEIHLNESVMVLTKRKQNGRWP